MSTACTGWQDSWSIQLFFNSEKKLKRWIINIEPINHSRQCPKHCEKIKLFLFYRFNMAIFSHFVSSVDHSWHKNSDHSILLIKFIKGSKEKTFHK